MPGADLYCRDALDAASFVRAGSVDLILTDLPYGSTRNSWDSVIDLGELWSVIRTILSPHGTVILTGQGLFTARLILSCEDWYRYKYVWVKSKATNFLNARRQPLRKHEDVCVFYRGQHTYNPQMTEAAPYDKGIRKDQVTGSYGDFDPVRVKSSGSRHPTDVLYFATAESEGRVWHPTQKPVALGRWLVRTFTDPGGQVLDLTSGSGSFVVAAVAEGRSAVGIEKYPEAKTADGSGVNLLEVTRQRIALVDPTCPVSIR